MSIVKKYHFGLAVKKLREEAIKLHRNRYSEVGFLNEDEQDPYEADSLYFVAQEDEINETVGVTRLIFKPLLELPTIENFTIYDLELKRLKKLKNNSFAEVSAFTKMPQHEVGMDIIRTVFQYSLQNGITHWVCCIDERVYKYLNRVFGPIFKLIGEPKVYLGSVSIPCVIDINEGVRAFKTTKPKLYDFIVNYENKIMEVSK
jgi:N-acyl-L-homoserine lactone synthetase